MSDPATLTLPPGWELEDGTTTIAGPSAQSTEPYSGATMNWALDGAPIWFLGCSAKLNGGPLYFSIFNLIGTALQNVPISNPGTGRGWLDVASDGWMYWSSWEGASIRPAGPPEKVPGAVRVAIGGFTPAPNGYIRVFADQDGFNGQADISLSSFGIPPASAYQIKVAVDAASAGRTLRAGPDLQTGGMVTARTVAPGSANRVYAEAIRAIPNGVLWVLADAGAIDHGFVDITGWTA